MRAAIAKFDGQEKLFPKPPYVKNRVYQTHPKSFQHLSLENLVKKFSKRFPDIEIPEKFIELRHAMAHGLISEINHSSRQELVKFKEIDNLLQVEFSLILNESKLISIKNELVSLRRNVMHKISELTP